MQDSFIRQNLDVFLVIILAAVAFSFLTWYQWTHPKVEVRYDCSIAEISPDYPIEVKEGCRKLRAKYFQEELKKPK
jgi:hypothetical protein